MFSDLLRNQAYFDWLVFDINHWFFRSFLVGASKVTYFVAAARRNPYKMNKKKTRTSGGGGGNMSVRWARNSNLEYLTILRITRLRFCFNTTELWLLRSRILHINLHTRSHVFSFEAFVNFHSWISLGNDQTVVVDLCPGMTGPGQLQV